MDKYFTLEDFAILQYKISNVVKKLNEISRAIGETCNQSSETIHDNFPYEEAVRQQALWSRRLDELSELSCGATVISQIAKVCEVRIGKRVKLEDLTTGDIGEYRIASFNIASYSEEKSAISYNSPLGDCLLGAQVGDIKILEIGDSVRIIKVLCIE